MRSLDACAAATSGKQGLDRGRARRQSFIKATSSDREGEPNVAAGAYANVLAALGLARWTESPDARGNDDAYLARMAH